MTTTTTKPSDSGYTQGHHDSVTRSHTARTAAKDAAFLLPHIKPHHAILDVGCGPGTITSGFCAHVPTGSVTGVDASSAVIAQARSLAASSSNPPPANLTFQTANVLAGLPFADATFDIVFTHQVLVHLPDRVRAIREMRRVCRPNGGLLASREGDGATFTWYPDPTGTLTLWRSAMLNMVTSGAGGSKHAGVALHTWYREAGLDPARMIRTTSATSYATPVERQWWAELHKERIEKSDVREKFLGVGGVTEHQLTVMGQAFLDWAADVDGVFAFLQYEVVCPV